MERRVSILLYEDKLTNAILISQKLKKDKYKISDIVSNYEDAISSIQNNSPQIILLENHSQNKKDMQKIIQTFQNKLNIPVICLLNEEIRTDQLNSCGALETPFNINQLDHIVNSVLNYDDIIKELSKVNQILDNKDKHRTSYNQNNQSEVLMDDIARSRLNSTDNINYIKEIWDSNRNQNQIYLEKHLDNIFFAFLNNNKLTGHIVTFEEGELFLKNKSHDKKELPHLFSSRDSTSIDCCHILKEAYKSGSPVISQFCGTTQTQYCLPKYNRFGQLTKFYLMQTDSVSEHESGPVEEDAENNTNKKYKYIKQKGEQFHNFIQDNLY